MSLHDDVNLLLTCAPAAPCPREDACYRVAKYLRDRLEPAEAPAKAPAEDGVVADYAPHWETATGLFRARNCDDFPCEASRYPNCI